MSAIKALSPPPPHALTEQKCKFYFFHTKNYIYLSGKGFVDMFAKNVSFFKALFNLS